MESLQGKNVVITGANTGIGQAMAVLFAKEGANIFVNYLFGDCDEVKAQVEAEGVRCVTYQADVSQFDEAKQMMDAAKAEMGSIDVLINNAGITRDGLIIRMSEEDFDAVINVNLKGAFNTIRHVANIMLKQKSGCIINVSSVVGVAGNIGQANYSASKAGLLGLTKTTARELAARGITCNAIAPGFIETAMTHKLSEEIQGQMLANIPLKRFGSIADIAETVVFLAKSRYITGQVIGVNGGMHM